MSGILGGINIDINKFQSAGKLLNHLGPDDQGEFSFENLYLFHRRLCLQNIEEGKQPFYYKTYTLIFNGKIYNHFDLRKRYKLNCRTNSDVETFLHLYDRFGLESLSLLDGMFAFALFNKDTYSLLLVRDRAGEKPLYISKENGCFIFCSELNALKSIINVQIDYQNIYEYLRYSFINSSTPYKNILEIPAGSYYDINIKTLLSVQKRWWKIDDFYELKTTLSFPGIIEKTDDILHKSISDRLKTSESEAGVFLSGGIDSGLITSIASKYNNSLKTFTITFKGQFDESSGAELISKKYNTIHKNIEISFSDLQNQLEKILANYGEPFGDSSAVPSYYVSREAKKYLSVILNGDGADELFGGYRRYVPFSSYDFFKSSSLIRNISQSISFLLPFPNNKQKTYNYIYRLIDLSRKDPVNAYLSATVDTFEGYTKYFISQDDMFLEMHKYLDHLNLKNLSGLQKIMCLDFNFILTNDLLVKMDIASMANSLELRTPFFNNELLEFAPTIADRYKIKGITTKYILRELAKKYLPVNIINQPKRGFEVPLRAWIESELKEIIFDYLSGDTFSENFIQKSFIEQLKNFKVKVAPEKRAKMLWRLLALEIWYKKCYLI